MSLTISKRDAELFSLVISEKADRVILSVAKNLQQFKRISPGIMSIDPSLSLRVTTKNLWSAANLANQAVNPVS